MPRQNVLLQALNRGLVSANALGRIDIEELRLAAEEMDNWLPMRLGPMRLRPGLGYIGATASNNASLIVPFIAGTLETALIELTANVMRVWVDDVLVTRPSVSTTIASIFSSSGWTDASTNGATLTFDANGLTLNTTNAGGIAKCTRQITVAGGDQNVEHGVTLIVPTGYDPVYLRIGSSAGAENYIEETRLLAGEHHLAFTPTGDFHLTIWATDRYAVTKRLSYLAVDPAANVAIATPWGASDLDLIQTDQSGDVIFVACNGQKQKRIERRSDRSWSVVDYRAFDGPFVGQTAPVKVKPAAATGRTTLTADRPLFKSTQVGGLFRLFHNGQNFRMDVGGEAVFSDPIRVNGVQGTNYNERSFGVTIAGTWVGTLNVERSLIGDDVGFGAYPRDASAATTVNITANATYANEDEDDNLVAWYRVGFIPGGYTSGTAQITFAYVFGGDFGIGRITAYTSSTSVDIEVLRPFRGTGYVDNWSEGAWTAAQGYPSALVIGEGRLWQFGGAQIWGSVSDDFESYDQENTNDDGPIVRTIGQGPVDNVNFAVALNNIVIGTDGSELVLRASSVDEPMTPTNFSIKTISTFGSKTNFPAVRIDESSLFVHRSGQHVLEIAPGQSRSGYVTTDLTLAVPDLLAAGVVSMAVQRYPETRVHCVLDDGTVAILTYDTAENLRSWVTLATGTTGVPSEVERVVVLPRVDEDAVYYVVKRTVGGSVKRFIEKFALLTECAGGTLNKQMDAFVVVANSPASTTVSGLSHLEGEAVVVWADGNVVEESDGADGYRAKEFTVSSGAITLSVAATSIVVGLAYRARFKSAKLAYAAGGGTALTQRKDVTQLGLLLGTTHHRGLKMGGTYTRMDNLPQNVGGATIATGTIHSAFDEPMIPFDGDWDTDSRVCLEGNAPYPVTVKALVVGVHTSG
jgi:hypothetical protein